MQNKVSLRAITAENWRPVALLKVAPDQEHFVAPSWYSILQAHYENLIVRAIYAGETPVGMTMYAYLPDEKSGEIIRLLIGKDYQQKGYGRAAMQLILQDLQNMPACEMIFISFIPDNTAAQALYSSLGFEDTGRIEEGEVLLQMNVKS